MAKSMAMRELVLHCMAKKEEGIWVAVCLNLSLAVQGDSLAEVRKKLEEQISYYVSEALDDSEYGAQLLTRSAPWSDWLEYYWARFLLSMNGIGRRTDRATFDEKMPLRAA